MYTLRLTQTERKAIDWIGTRYSNGSDLFYLLWVECDQTPDDADWDSNATITFSIPDRVAHTIAEMREEEGGWPCFCPELTSKLNTLVNSIP